MVAVGPHHTLDPFVSLTQQKLIGRVIVLFGKLEGAVGAAIWELADLMNDDGRILTQRRDIEDNMITLRALAKRHLTEERMNQLTPILELIKNLQESRNMMAHGSWGTLQPDGKPLAFVLRKKSEPGKVTGETFTRERMLAIVDELRIAHKSVVDLIDELASASRGTPPWRLRPLEDIPDEDQSGYRPPIPQPPPEPPAE